MQLKTVGNAYVSAALIDVVEVVPDNLVGDE
jgi:hypothetical protein